jgi:hypothetical protein
MSSHCVANPPDSFLNLTGQAERDGLSLIACACEFGTAAVHGFDPANMPTPHQEAVLKRVLELHSDGIRGYPDMVPHFPEEDLKAVLIEATESVTHSPSGPAVTKPFVERLGEFHRQRSLRIVADRIRQKLESGDDIGPELAEAAAIQAKADGLAGQSLLERALALQFDPAKPQPPDEVCMTIGRDFPIAARGNITVIQGKAKAGKSAVISALLGAAQSGTYSAKGDTLSIEWAGDDTGAILHFDTEQSPADFHALNERAIKRSGLGAVSPRLISIPLVRFTRSERMEIVRQTLVWAGKESGSVAAVILDGVADLCASPNDETEALELVSELLALAHRYRCPITTVIHENPGSDSGKTRGHLGSELNRKAFANLRIDKDTEADVSTIYGPDMRKREIPKSQGFCFGWDDEAGMHVFKGRAAGLKAAMRDADRAAKFRQDLEPLFEFHAADREKSGLPDCTAEMLCEADREITGKGKPIKADTMRKRLQEAEKLGVLRKIDKMHWRFIPPGTSGNDRENEESSRT